MPQITYASANNEIHYNLCPVCGLPSEGTSRVCSKHINITYDSFGHIVRHQDIPNDTPLEKYRIVNGKLYRILSPPYLGNCGFGLPYENPDACLTCEGNYERV